MRLCRLFLRDRNPSKAAKADGRKARLTQMYGSKTSISQGLVHQVEFLVDRAWGSRERIPVSGWAEKLRIVIIRNALMAEKISLEKRISFHSGISGGAVTIQKAWIRRCNRRKPRDPGVLPLSQSYAGL